MGFLLFCDVDAEGNITSFVAGQYVIPSRQFDYFFYLVNEVGIAIVEDLSSYKIVDGQLVKK
jgi:hypothetical protein